MMSEVHCKKASQANFSKLPLLTRDSFSESHSAGIGTLPWPERRHAMKLVDSRRPFWRHFFSWLSVCKAHVRACWCYTGPNPRLDQRRKLIHYDVVSSSSHTLDLVKLHQTAHRHRVQHPERSIRFRFRSDPDRLLDALFLFWKAAEHSKPGSRGQNFKHAIILLLVSSQNLDHLVVGGCESYISSTFCHSGGAKRKQKSSSSHRLILRFFAY